MPGDPTPLGLLNDSLRRLAERVEEAEKDLEQLPVLETKFEALTDRVEALVKSTDRNTNALITVAGSLLVSGVCAVIVALIVKGVIG